MMLVKGSLCHSFEVSVLLLSLYYGNGWLDRCLRNVNSHHNHYKVVIANMLASVIHAYILIGKIKHSKPELRIQRQDLKRDLDMFKACQELMGARPT